MQMHITSVSVSLVHFTSQYNNYLKLSFELITKQTQSRPMANALMAVNQQNHTKTTLMDRHKYSAPLELL